MAEFKENHMRNNTMKRSFVAAGLALALPFGLAACGGDDKPSKEEVRAGLDSMLADQGMGTEDLEQLGVEGDIVDDYFNCIVDGIYDDVSNDTLNALADNNPDASLPSEDEEVFQDATMACTSELGF